MAKKYFSQLDFKKRDRMESLLLSGHSQTEVAAILKVHKSTISRERKRHRKRGGVYDADVANTKAKNKRALSKHRGMKIEGNKELKKYLITHLKEKRSPDEIAGRMKKEKKSFAIGKTAIYLWLRSAFGQRYCIYLCTKRYRTKHRNAVQGKREMIPGAISHTKAPQGSLGKTRCGHSEGDTAVSPQSSGTSASLAVVTFKKEKTIRLRKIPNRKPKTMRKAIQVIGEKTKIKSMILDRGIENKQHEKFGMPTFFCDPHAPWQKPHVENQIGLLRRWHFKKKTDFSKVSWQRVKKAEDHLNNKWRKSLGYRSANEFAEERGILEKKRREKLLFKKLSCS